ncbi:MAG: esterase/lipase/thioesterase family active site [Proteobacteria bacterium]|nr:esterase/lipase/thioesterase family active site [Pseudomonadota bacterium]
MSIIEQAFCFSCNEEELLGIVATSEKMGKTGVLIVVGGPQYRVGSHRQFLLLSRYLALCGYPTMRFDYRGMGDSSGNLQGFESITEDIAAAIEAFLIHCPQLERIVLWGLCDAASACLMYQWAKHDVQIGGVVLLNPWVRSEATLAQTHIKHYYAERLLQMDFWRKLLSGKLGIVRAITGFLRSLRAARLGAAGAATNAGVPSFQEQMLDVLDGTQCPVLLVLSGNDYVAKEFLEFAASSDRLSAILRHPKITRRDIEEADHTFSRAEWRSAVEKATEAWLKVIDLPS